MKKIALILCIIYSLSAVAQEKFTIEGGETHRENQLGIDLFYFVHQTFADAFYMNGLSKQLTYDEMYSILENVYYRVTEEEKVRILIPQVSGPDAVLAFQVIKDTKNGDLFVLATNFNNKTRVFEKEVDAENSIYRWYYMKKGKLVYRKDLYSKKAEKEKSKEAYELIDMYLFDDNFKNDTKAKPLIDKLLASDQEDSKKLYGYLYLGEYWLMQRELAKAEEALVVLKTFYDQSTTIPKGYSLLPEMATTEIEMMKRFLEK